MNRRDFLLGGPIYLPMVIAQGGVDNLVSFEYLLEQLEVDERVNLEVFFAKKGIERWILCGTISDGGNRITFIFIRQKL